MNDVVGILVAVLLLAGNAFFVAAEFSLISARRDRLETIVDESSSGRQRRARTVIRAGERLSLMLAGAQLGITICSILLGRVAEPALAHLIESPLHWAHVPTGLTHPIAFVVALALVVVLHIMLGEMVPKNIALAGPERAAMLLVPAHLLFIRLARPLIGFYNWSANISLRALRIDPKDELEATVTEGELSVMLAESRDEGLLDAQEHERLTRALTTSARPVREVAIGLSEIHSVPVRTDSTTGRRGPTLGSIEDAVVRTGYSRYPVRGIDGTKPATGPFLGYLHVKDVLDEILDDTVHADTIVGADRIHPLPRIDADLPLDDAITALRRESSHLGAVIDEAGITVGIVALEDLVEELIGTLPDDTHRR